MADSFAISAFPHPSPLPSFRHHHSGRAFPSLQGEKKSFPSGLPQASVLLACFSSMLPQARNPSLPGFFTKRSFSSVLPHVIKAFLRCILRQGNLLFPASSRKGAFHPYFLRKVSFSSLAFLFVHAVPSFLMEENLFSIY